ncbi:MAG: nucleotidyltransferase family protein [Bacteroidota bacterium]
MGYLNLHMNDIVRLCSSHKVRHLYAFGSALTDQFGPKSDIDLIVDFLPLPTEDYADNYYDLKFSLEKILNRSIDLLEEKGIKNPYFIEAINSKKQLVYGN